MYPRSSFSITAPLALESDSFKYCIKAWMYEKLWRKQLENDSKHSTSGQESVTKIRRKFLPLFKITKIIMDRARKQIGWMQWLDFELNTARQDIISIDSDRSTIRSINTEANRTFPVKEKEKRQNWNIDRLLDYENLCLRPEKKA